MTDTDRPDNPPAFARSPAYDPHGSFGHGQEGMSLRDWFAGMALQGMLADRDRIVAELSFLSEDAYKYADAMLAARGRT